MSPIAFLDYPFFVGITPVPTTQRILGGQDLNLGCENKVDHNVGFIIASNAPSGGPRRRVKMLVSHAPTDHCLIVLPLGLSDILANHLAQDSRNAWVLELASFSPALILIRQLALLRSAFTPPSRTAGIVAPNCDAALNLDAIQVIDGLSYRFTRP